MVLAGVCEYRFVYRRQTEAAKAELQRQADSQKCISMAWFNGVGEKLPCEMFS